MVIVIIRILTIMMILLFAMMTMMIIFHSDDLDNNIFYISSLFDCSGPPHPRLIPGNENDDDNGDLYIIGAVCLSRKMSS